MRSKKATLVIAAILLLSCVLALMFVREQKTSAPPPANIYV